MVLRMLSAVGASYLVLGQEEPIGRAQLARSGRSAGKAKVREASEELVAFILSGFAAPSAVRWWTSTAGAPC